MRLGPFLASELGRDLKCARHRCQVISLITPHVPSRAGLIIETWRSILDQDVEWEWLIQIDGQRCADLPDGLLSDARIQVEENGEQLGIANTRNLALSRAKGEFVYPIDDDDILLEGALQNLQKALAEHPDCAGATGIPLFYDGQGFAEWTKCGVSIKDTYAVPGRVEIEGCYSRRRDLGSHLLASGTGFLWRSEAIWKAGGWPALSGAEDSALLFQINASNPIYIIDKETLGYRVHSGQESQSDEIIKKRDRLGVFMARMSAAVAGSLVRIPVEKPKTLEGTSNLHYRPRASGKRDRE